MVTMNLSNLVENHKVTARQNSSTTSRSADKKNVFYLPIKHTIFQDDINEMLIKLHKNHLIQQFGLQKSAQNNSNFKFDESSNALSDLDLLNLLYSNLNLASNNPYLLVDHYIPKNMLLMNTKDSLRNISGKFALLHKIISMYEKLNNDNGQKKFDVLLLASNSKELDFVESLLIGRLVNYKRYSGSKLFESHPEKVSTFNSSGKGAADGATSTGSNQSGSASRRNANSKDDPYLIRRLRKKHKRIMKYISNNSYNQHYCLTVHLITINQLKFQFFSNKDPKVNFDFLDLNNDIKFNFILSFNNYVNLDHYYLKKLRSGYINRDSKKFVKYSEPLPILKLLSVGSIDHATIAVYDWLADNKVIDTNINYNKKFIDERPTKFAFDLNHEVLLLILKIYLVVRNRENQSLEKQFSDYYFNDLAQLKHWLTSLNDGKKSSEFDAMGLKKIPVLKLSSTEDHRLKFHNYLSQFGPAMNDNDPLKNDIASALEEFGLKFFRYENDKNLQRSEVLLTQNNEIFQKFPHVLNSYCNEESEVVKKARKEFGDSTNTMPNALEQPKKKSKIDNEAPQVNIMHGDTDLAKKILNKLQTLESDYNAYKQQKLDEFQPITEFPISLEAYKKSCTKLLKLRSDNLSSLNDIYFAKLNQENLLGNYLQLKIEKNNYISRDLFTKQLDLKKINTKEEKYYEKIFSDYKKFKVAERLMLSKIFFFYNHLQTANNGQQINAGLKSESEIYKSLGHEANYDEDENSIIKDLDQQFEVDVATADTATTAISDDVDNLNEVTRYMNLNNKKFDLNLETNELEVKDAGSTVNDFSINTETLKNQELIITHLEKQISNYNSESEQLSNSIEESRSAYQSNSAKLSVQVDTMNILEKKFTSIQGILSKKDQLLLLKEKALNFSLQESEEVANITDKDKIFNNSKYTMFKYQDLLNQKYFLANYMELLKNCFSDKKITSANNFDGGAGSGAYRGGGGGGDGTNKRLADGPLHHGGSKRKASRSTTPYN